ncbi:MAG: heme-binding protein [Pseudomonadota bacterium]
MRTATAALGMAVAAALGMGGSAVADDESFTTFRSLKPELSVEAAQAAIAECRERGFQVAVSVTDRFGVLQVTIRDQLAGAHTPDTAFRKAWTAASFRTSTGELAELAETGEAWAIRTVSNALPLGGGIRIVAGEGDMVGAIGVSGAPSTAEDEACAEAGIAAIEDRISF